MKNNRLFLPALLLALILCAVPSHALRNPAAAYCQALGYTYVMKETPNGTVGSCAISGSVECGAWDFLGGRCAAEHSYCMKQGLGQREGVGSECGVDNKNALCLVCIQADGSVQEVTRAMNLSLKEGVCGDGVCVVGENNQNCPKDCPAGPKTVKYRYWDDLGNETTTTAAANDNGHASTTVPAANNTGSSTSSFYLILAVLVLLIVLSIGLSSLKNRGNG